MSSLQTAEPSERAPRWAHAAGRLWLPFLFTVATSIAVIGIAIGAEYYMTPFSERPFSDQYDRFRPAGTYGLRYGIVGLTLIAVGVAVYSSRKRVKWLARAGKLKYWLEFHIFLCIVGPFLVTLHTSFKVGGLVAIAYWSMVIVALSGIFGRYVYVRIPKTVQGQFAGLAAIEAQRAELIQSLAADLGPRTEEVERLVTSKALAKPRTLVGAIGGAVKFDFSRRATIRRVKEVLTSAALSPDHRVRVLHLVQRQLEIEHQMALTLPFQRLFRSWHLLHLPLAIAMFLIAAVHVIVATLFGFGFSS